MSISSFFFKISIFICLINNFQKFAIPISGHHCQSISRCVKMIYFVFVHRRSSWESCLLSETEQAALASGSSTRATALWSWLFVAPKVSSLEKTTKIKSICNNNHSHIRSLLRKHLLTLDCKSIREGHRKPLAVNTQRKKNNKLQALSERSKKIETSGFWPIYWQYWSQGDLWQAVFDLHK